LFIEQAIHLLKPGGFLGFITPSTFLMNNYTTNLRSFILNNCEIRNLMVIPDSVFEAARIDNAIIVLRKEPQRDSRRRNVAACARASYDRVSGLTTPQAQQIVQSSFEDAPGYLFAFGTQTGIESLLEVIASKSVKLGDLAHIHFGMQLRDRDKYPNDVIVTANSTRLSKYYKPCVTGKDIGRYRKTFNNRYAYVHEEARRGGCWDQSIHFAPEKVLVRQIGESPIASFDGERLCCLNTLFMIVLHEPDYSHRYILGVLNSRLMAAYWRAKYSDYKKTFPKIKGTYLKQLPIRRIDFGDPADKRRHDSLVKRVEEMLQLQKDYTEAERNLDDRRHALKRRIEQVDAAIDRMVYELYGLTEEEIAVVEGQRATSHDDQSSG
jgi:hypothetical protein